MLKCVFTAPDEFTAVTIQAMLQGKDIRAMIRRFETSWLDGLPRMMKGGWGEVLVDEDDLAEADAYVKEFFQDLNIAD
jgi:NifB/MoaA-like Fe-S oxidoreductase